MTPRSAGGNYARHSVTSPGLTLEGPRTTAARTPVAAGTGRSHSSAGLMGCQAVRVRGDPEDDEDQSPTLRAQGIIAFDVHNTATAGPLPGGWSPGWADSDVR